MSWKVENYISEDVQQNKQSKSTKHHAESHHVQTVKCQKRENSESSKRKMTH
jgi:hypothetical protein